MATNFEKLQKLLEELFQLDQADLDFGIYRIMNQKREEVVRFLEKDLLPQVKEAFSHYKSADKATLQKELDKAIEQANGLGVDPETTTKVKDLREQMADSSVDVTALENEVFSHLFNFFRRYYHEGDFISLRRYKEGVYAIPYEGEEVKLHWANHDQYYVKSSEYFRDYIFTMPSGKRVRVHLVAASSEQDNKKEQAGKERRFVICEEDPIYEENGELFIRFEYKSDNGKKKQDALNQEAIERVLKSEGFEEWTQELSKPAPTKANPKRTVLEKHLTQYTARNTFDYFIHKDLGGFLRRELDFYIKNEVMHLDDIEHDTVPRVDQYLSKIKVIRKIAHKIIQFLEQLENFQKKLWLKKKFVVETNYCITLDRVPEELYPEIAANDAQREEWVRLFAIDEIEKDLNGPGFSTPLTVEFLSSNPNLVVDTRFFPQKFRDRLLSLIEELDEQCDGLLVNSDNFHALTLLRNRFRECVSCVYIDPPYNTGNDGFIYKDSYRHSSWLSCLHDRLILAAPLMNDLGSLFMSIDDNEQVYLREVTDSVLGDQNFIATVIWQKVYSPKNSARHFSEDHDFVIVYAKNAGQWTPSLLPRTEEANARYQNFDDDPRGPWKPSDLTARNYYSKGRYEVVGPTGKTFTSGVGRFWRQSEEVFWEMDADNRIWWGPNKDSMPAQKRFLSEVQQGRVPQTLWPYKEVGHTQEAKKELLSTVPYTDTSDVLNTVKPVGLIRRVIQLGTTVDARCVVLDFFAGSGTTVQAVLQQNAEDGGDRKVVAVELGEYFDTTTRIRAIRSLSNPTWKDGKPVGERSGSGILKYILLESYDDALNNLEMKPTAQQASLLEQDDDLREQYILSYMLDVESRGSQSLLNVESFRNPDEYKLRVERNGETQLVNVDLVETFNWLLGLTVKHIDVIRGVRVVEGTNPDGDRALVLWRNLDEIDNDALDEWFKKQDYNTKDQEYDLIYVNGDNNLENLRRGDQTWKVRLTEEEFGRLMFNVEDV
ncbi:site-specific DNA-methyltransferase [Gimesia chilikensis]|uniref:site-specific DNA-methyltransferase n=1 Tax=Gimesia chilikensis TaxID=2605989 RepID=UPI0011F09AB5|nr:site-specific DNA-methyltransferase [Gimesia chilikensis]KAA0131597.1 site-specific DNA-methyltransferase [Gimesia chilikensis]